MSQWRALREGEESLDEVQIAFTCMAPGMDADGISGLGPAGCSGFNSGGSGDSLEVECGINEAIRSWQYEDDGTITYVCCEVASVDGTESARTTTGKQVTNEELYELTSLNYDCPLGQALRKFSLRVSSSNSLNSASFSCINVPLRRNIKEPNVTLQKLEWDQFRGSWVLERAVNVQIRTPVVDIASTTGEAPCPDGYAMVSWKMGNHGSEEQISALHPCRGCRLQMTAMGCRIVLMLLYVVLLYIYIYICMFFFGLLLTHSTCHCFSNMPGCLRVTQKGLYCEGWRTLFVKEIRKENCGVSHTSVLFHAQAVGPGERILHVSAFHMLCFLLHLLNSLQDYK